MKKIAINVKNTGGSIGIPQCTSMSHSCGAGRIVIL